MISSKAERYLADSLCDAGTLVDKDGVGMLVVRRSDARHIVELTEGELLEKAGAVFCSEHCFAGCPYTDKDCCGVLRRFKQKLIGA